MAKPTRDEVLARAYEAYPKCGYVYGGYYGEGRHAGLVNGRGDWVSGGPYIACDCSGFIDWAWGIGQHDLSGSWGPVGAPKGNGKYGGQVGRYHPKSGNTGIIEQDMPGIQPADVLWKSGHVGLYVGNNTVLELYTSDWAASPTGRGAMQSTGSARWSGYTSYDGDFSADYDPDAEPPLPPIDVWTPPPTGPSEYTDQQQYDDELYYIAVINSDRRYTRKYRNMKAWRNT